MSAVGEALAGQPGQHAAGAHFEEHAAALRVERVDAFAETNRLGQLAGQLRLDRFGLSGTAAPWRWRSPAPRGAATADLRTSAANTSAAGATSGEWNAAATFSCWIAERRRRPGAFSIFDRLSTGPLSTACSG